MPRRLLVPFLWVGTLVTPAVAQDPARLPAVVVNAAPDPPGPRKIAGVVRDTVGFPIDGVDITMPALRRRATSGANGGFRFDDVAPETYELRARRIGYAPQIHSVKVDTAGGVVAFALVPMPAVLYPVITSAARGGLSGVVGDTAYNALPNAKVSVLGHADWTVTDSLGGFYIPVRAGSYTVAVERAGFADRIVSVIVPPDSGRRVTVTLRPGVPKTVRQVWNIQDLSTRLAWRNNNRSTYYTRAELEKMNIEWVHDAVQMGATRVGFRDVVDDDCQVVLDGGPQVAVLNTLTVDDIESVEVYVGSQAPARFPTPRRGAKPADSRGPFAGVLTFSNTEIAAHANLTRKCPLVYVWRR
jgi:hypothetical protein